MEQKPFIHLHTHSHYSLLDGLGKAPELLEKAKEYGMPALAITDHGVMYGAIDFYKTAKDIGIKPIIGMESYISPRKLTDKISNLDTKPFHITLLAENEQGYINLLKLSSIAHLRGYYYKPRIDKETLSKYSKGLIALSSCLQGEIPRSILNNNTAKTKQLISEYQKIFGEKNFYLELQDHENQAEEQKLVNKTLINLAKEVGAPLIATNDIHYTNIEDKEAHDILLCIQTGKTIDEENRMKYDGNFALRSTEEMYKLFKDTPEALENTQKITDRCNLEIKLEQDLLPHFKIPKGKDEKTYLRELCEAGLPKRYKKITPEIKKRLEYELEVINRMEYASYFLIVADFVNYAKKLGILIGPGRGSAAGSIVSYLLGVTNLDPLRYGLLFERFLNPDRISMPDIDMDFADDRRREVIDYVVDKYGKDKVAGVITFGTMAARAAIRDTGRALGMTYNDVDRIAKIVPPPVQGRHIPLKTSVKENSELRAVYEKEPETKKLIDQASKLEGTIRHASQHACAVVISKDDLTNYSPLQLAQGGDIDVITQYSMYPIEDIGLLKMDFLGLANLSIMGRAIEIIEAVYGDKIDIHNLPLDDKKTFELLGRAETTGVFQLESSGMKRYIKDLKPNTIDDIIVMVSLYRPGPMQFIPNYIDRKHGRESISYEHPLMEKSLKETYGVIVYQEQVMQMSRDMAGFTGGESDTLRKAMGKKIPKLMKEMGKKFMEGCIKNKVPKDTAEKIYQQLLEFSAYAFNKSHAASYAMIAYQTAYLKAHFPDCFMAALLTSDYANIDRITIEVEECKRMGMDVLPPDVNESFQGFAVVKGTHNIRFGLAAVKNIGMGVADKIVRERKSHGVFKTLEDFLKRAGSEVINKKSMESLIKVGALDKYGERNLLLFNIDTILKFASAHYRQTGLGQADLFGGQADSVSHLKLASVEEASSKQRLAWEKELLGIYLSEHPLTNMKELLDKHTNSINQVKDLSDGNTVVCAGVITKMKKITTKNGQPMLFTTIEDLSGNCEILVFPKILENDPNIWLTDNQIIVSGKISTKDADTKILVDKVQELNEDDL
ncbi:MAG: DNA polymerase III subunit alpha, partial [bacterium]